MTTPDPQTGTKKAAAAQEGTVKETLISLTISLAVAFTAKAYVLEAFMIPTGSMAPTLLGKHITFHSTQSGAEWDVNTWYHDAARNPLKQQGGNRIQRSDRSVMILPSPVVTDPYSTSLLDDERGQQGWAIQGNKKTRAGDRILVQKYLPIFGGPSRWDVTVFKNPTDRTQNYIKRCIGLPMEELWLCDGDVFVRPLEKDGAGGLRVKPGAAWEVQRKPDRIQRALWRTVYSSEFAPRDPSPKSLGPWFVPPWSGDGWDAGTSVSYRCESDAPSTLSWNTQDWPVRDRVAYNQFPPHGAATDTAERMQSEAYPVSDVRLRAGLAPDQAGALTATAHVTARGHEFECVFDLGAGAATLRICEAGGEWVSSVTGNFAKPGSGAVTDVEFWHFDQRLEAWVGGKRIAQLDYDWDGHRRLAQATGRDADAPGLRREIDEPETWAASAPTIAWRFEGSPLTMHRVGLDRDIYYEVAPQSSTRQPPYARASTDDNAAELGPDHYFMCGDNSPASSDGRAWTGVDDWIADQVDTTPGVVNRELIMGKAFFVYFPAWHTAFGKVPVPDFGNMRAIR